jgi:replicative DNA helicase
MSRTEKTLPQNVEAEQGVLGSLIIDPEALNLVVDFLRAEDFYRDAHRIIFEVILALSNRREQADFITICDLLERRQKLEDIGGASYITSLINCVPTSGNIVYYAHIVEGTALRRRFIRASGEIAALAYDEEEVDVVSDRAEQVIFEISQRASRLSSDATLAELLAGYMERLELLVERRGQIVGVPSGLSDLDRLTGGFRKEDLIVLAARPGIGKTSCALSIAYQAAVIYRQRIGIFSLEMSQEQVTERFVSMETGINLQRLNTGRIEDDEWEKIVRGAEVLSDTLIRVDGTSVLSPVQMRSRARRWVQEDTIDLLIVDYMQLLQPSDDTPGKRENRVQIIDEISRNLKLLARELKVPILVLAQLSRAVESRQSKIPQLSDLRESGGIENNADIVMFIYRDEVYNPESERRGYGDIIVAKHRNGPTGSIVVRFEPETTRFRDVNPFEDDEADEADDVLVVDAESVGENDIAKTKRIVPLVVRQDEIQFEESEGQDE